jgi:hypothetical protein
VLIDVDLMSKETAIAKAHTDSSASVLAPLGDEFSMPSAEPFVKDIAARAAVNVKLSSEAVASLQKFTSEGAKDRHS